MATPMEQFMLQHAERHKKLVRAFQPSPPTGRPVELVQPNPDIVVAARIRPLLPHEAGAGIPPGVFTRTTDANTIDLHELRQVVRGPPPLKSSQYKVDHSFSQDVTTETIYDALVKNLVSWAWAGGIATLFAYGQTGSGKTFTVGQLEELVAGQLMSDVMDGERKVSVTIIELAGTQAFDLLNSRKTVSILEDAFGVTQIAGAMEQQVKSTQDMLTLIDSASVFRKTEETVKNDTSSRSHAICRIRIQNPADTVAEDGMLYMVDLAGSEAARDKAHHDAERMRETRHINTSLSVLKDCIRGRAEADVAMATGSKKKPYVPFRQANLTKVLKHVFDPHGTRGCKTVVIACVNPSLLDLQASKNTLRYAEMLRVLLPKEMTLKYDTSAPMTWSNAQIQKWIASNSGTPTIDGSILAPIETGAQLLRLPPHDFEARCRQTDGVKPEQAKAFRAKLWQMHVDSQAALTSGPPKKRTDEDDGTAGHLNAMDRSSSRHPDPQVAQLPFKERIAPGMVVSWTPKRLDPLMLGRFNMAYILCPASAAGAHAQDMKGQAIEKQGSEGGPISWLCAAVNPGVLHESYEIHLWRHIVIDVEQMDAEVLLEYDPGTRYYFIGL